MPAITMKKTKTKTKPAPVLALEAPSYTPPLYDPAAGEAALDALGPTLADLSEGEMITVNLDVEVATYAALGVVGFVSDADVRARFAQLPEEELDITHVDGLGDACFATLHAIAEARAAGALKDGAAVPAALTAEATELEERMQALCEYHFSDDPEIKPELDRLRSGSGHRDLANDLLGYARIYELRAGVVEADGKYYRAGDAARAKELAGLMIQKLSAAMTPRARAAYDRYVRVWTLLNQRYDEVRAAGVWLYRKDSLVQQRFPSLFAAARPNVGRPRKAEPTGAQGDAGGGDGAAPNPA